MNCSDDWVQVATVTCSYTCELGAMVKQLLRNELQDFGTGTIMRRTYIHN
jgi:hypothetical protein